MAHNWAVTPRKTRALRVIDLLTTPLAALDRLTRRRASTADTPRRILVVECWQLGDAIMAVPFLRALRARFPDAHVALLCKASTRTLLEPSALVDEYVVANLPWTAFSGKYALSRYVDGSVRALVRRLRSAHYDVTVDARSDVRANVLTWLTRAPMRIGFGGAGARLLTHPVPGPRADTHKVEDWLAMLTPLGGNPRAGRDFRLLFGRHMCLGHRTILKRCGALLMRRACPSRQWATSPPNRPATEELTLASPSVRS